MDNLKTPSELIEMFPDCGYTAQDLGRLVRLQAIRGKKIHNTCLILVTSFLKFIEYRNMNITNQDIKPVTLM